MDSLFDLNTYSHDLESIRAWIVANALTLGVSGFAQIAVVGLAFLAARFAAVRAHPFLESVAKGWRYEQQLRRIASALDPLTLPIIWLTLQWLSVLIAAQAGLPYQLVKIVVSLITAWVVIRLTTTLVRDRTWSRFIAIAAWTIAALNILSLLEPTTELLDGIAVRLGTLRISALTVIKGVLALAVLLWLATVASRILERRLTAMPNLTPSLQVLLSKLVKIVFATIAIVVALNSVGIDLTAFALFSGAVGLGIGFGLQKAVSNFISGVMLLLDKSVKPGDVITVGETYGWVSSLGARYVSVRTRDGTEYLIPNEDLITHQVVNWSFTSNHVRLKIPVQVSSNADIHQARALCLEAAADCPRVLKEPQPVCLLLGFANGSVDFELRIWIDDPRNGTVNAKSDVLVRIWDKFLEHGIEVSYPQREVRLRTPVVVEGLAG